MGFVTRWDSVGLEVENLSEPGEIIFLTWNRPEALVDVAYPSSPNRERPPRLEAGTLEREFCGASPPSMWLL